MHLETYIFADDDIGRALRDLLIRRAPGGHRSARALRRDRQRDDAGGVLRADAQAGVEVLQFRPLNPDAHALPWKLNNRDHRKIVVVDGRIAFTGGINISGAYASSSSSRPGPEAGREEAWRDTHVQIEGPVAAQFQTLFLETWQRAGGRIERRLGALLPAARAGRRGAGRRRGNAAAAIATKRRSTTRTRPRSATLRAACG